jgi:para-nitrobenzyl esterase
MNPIVETSYGQLRGSDAGGITTFRGIPYARPPVGALRFRTPQPPAPWPGVRDASAFGAPAPQNASALGPVLSIDTGQQSEDCLYLNVWTPGLDDRRRPVLVWIHGGGFVIGAGSQAIYDGTSLARRGDVVVVTLNYRLGAFGFLHIPPEWSAGLTATGNEGLLDQVAALRWVHDEIARFGGDPDNVTIFGESAGSISCALQLTMPAARGLFQRAILQSGSVNMVRPRALAARATDIVLQALDLSPRDAARLLDVDTADLLRAQQRAYAVLNGEHPLPFSPVTDGDVVPESPFAAIGAGAARDVSLLVGTNADEMRLFGLVDTQAFGLDDAGLLSRCQRVIPGAQNGEASRAQLAIDTYRAARARREQPVDPPALWFAIDSDRLFRHAALRLAELQYRQQPQTYAYLFTWPSPLFDGRLGACHALDLPFVFGTLADPAITLFCGSDADAAALSERIQDAWIAFARHGDPAHTGIGAWPAYDPATRPTMLLGPECRVESAPLEEERRFWDACPTLYR